MSFVVRRREVISMITRLDLNDSQIDVLSELYAEADGTLGDLPNTEDFERLYSQFLTRDGVSVDSHCVWKALCNARQASWPARSVKS
jgi:hypothetical protein